jgi:hypothetical protein
MKAQKASRDVGNVRNNRPELISLEELEARNSS